jgi:hypothetical protein
MPFYPPTTGSRLVWGLGLAVLLLSLWLQMRMWLVVFGLMPVAAGGGESMVALFVGLPALAVAGAAVVSYRAGVVCCLDAAVLRPLSPCRWADNLPSNKESSMVRFVLGLLLAASGSCAMADWVKVTDSMEGKVNHYIDPATLRKMGSLMQVVTLTDYQEVQTISDTQRFMSVKMRDEFNCAEQSGRHLSLVALAGNMGTGPVVATEERAAPVRAIASGTADEEMWKHVCGKD